MRQVGFEPTIPVFERAKTVHALNRATTVIGLLEFVERIQFWYASVSYKPHATQRPQTHHTSYITQRNCYNDRKY
jgi:hypothetical protein